jgi:hypothetical protein
MRILALAILTIATVSAAPSARAQTYDAAYPVCLQIYQGWNDFTLNAAIPRCHCAMPQHPAAPHSASSTHITRGAKQRRRDGETGGIAASIELIQRKGGTPDWAEG